MNKLQTKKFSLLRAIYRSPVSRVGQWKRAGPITQSSEDQNLALLIFFIYFFHSYEQCLLLISSPQLESGNVLRQSELYKPG